MGILLRPAQVIPTLNLPKGFTVCELGNQIYRADGQKMWAFQWYETLGCSEYASIDANGNATHFADLNYPLSEDLGQFDLVTDFGTGEHIFDQAQVWKTLHGLAKVGGLIAIDRPHQGWDGHCFYNIQRTLIEDIIAANSYQPRHMEVHTLKDHGTIIFCVLQKTSDAPFQYPTQGKYKERLLQAKRAGG